MNKWFYTIFMVLMIAVLLTVTNGKFATVNQASANSHTTTPTPTNIPSMKITICHYDNGQGGKYTSNTISINSVSDCQNAGGHDGHSNDIIPSYTYGTCTYAGKNVSMVSWISNNCSQPVTPTPTKAQPTPTPTSVPTATPTPTTVIAPTATPTLDCDGDNDGDQPNEDDNCDDSDDITATPTPTIVITYAPTATPTEGPTATPTEGPTATPAPCTDNCGGGGSSNNNSSNNSSNPPTQAVLSASDMADTGTFTENMMNILMTLGMISLVAGVTKYAKARKN